MPVILLVLVLGTALNVANTQPHNCHDVRKALVDQVMHPVTSPVTIYNK